MDSYGEARMRRKRRRKRERERKRKRERYYKSDFEYILLIGLTVP